MSLRLCCVLLFCARLLLQRQKLTSARVSMCWRFVINW